MAECQRLINRKSRERSRESGRGSTIATVDTGESSKEVNKFDRLQSGRKFINHPEIRDFIHTELLYIR